MIFHYNLKFKKTVVDVITPTIYFLRKNNYKNISILATKNTINMDIYSRLIEAEINYIDSSILINEIENDNVNLDTVLQLLSMVNSNCDVILLGCTHLIKIKDLFRKNTDIKVLSQDEIFILFLNEKI